MAEGRVHSINVSGGGVPKLPRETCVVRRNGLEGDRQRDLEEHGGPTRAVSLYSMELIEALRAEGHPIAPGTAGENLTLAGLNWAHLGPGARLQVGEGELRIESYAGPCSIIEDSFKDRRSGRISQKAHPGWSRLYARVLKEGVLRVGDRVRMLQPPPTGANHGS